MQPSLQCRSRTLLLLLLLAGGGCTLGPPAAAHAWLFWPQRQLLSQQQQQQQQQQPHRQQQQQARQPRMGGSAGVEAVSAEEVLAAAARHAPRPDEVQALQIQMLRRQVEQLPLQIEQQLSARLAEILLTQIKSLLIDPTQAAVLNATLSGTYNPMGARMVHFKGKDLLVLAPKNDEFVGHHILATGTPFSPHMLGPMMDLITPGSTVVDAGANIGSFTVFFAAATGSRGRVYSFEPQRKMYQVLSANAIVNGLLNVFPQHMALSHAPGLLHMSAHVPDGSAAGQNLSAAEDQGMAVNYGGMSLGSGGEAVRSATLDSFNLTGVSLIKVDVQGAEKLLFYGARDTIRRNLPVVVFEQQLGWLDVTDEMNTTLDIPPAVHAFNVTAFLLSLGYRPSPHQPSSDDVFMLPAGHPLLADGSGSGSGRWHF